MPPPPEEREDALLLAWLAGDADAPRNLMPGWMRRIAALADAADTALDVALRRGLSRPEARLRWADAMPDAIVVRVLHRIAPARAGMLMDARALLATAWRRTRPGQAHAATATVTAQIFALIAADPDAPPRRALAALIAGIAERREDHAAALTAHAARLARQAGHAHLRAALPPPTPAPPLAPSPPTRPPQVANGSRLYVGNAGLVLLNPFLPRLFDQLGVLTTEADGKRRITGTDAASRAVHILQFIADERCDAPEPELALNKLLCGLPLATPIAPSLTLSDADHALCASLLQGVLGQWPVLSNTSPAGLRETFFQRDGRLERGEGRWTLTVSRRTLDVLVDQIPWSFALLLHGWMPEPIHVDW